MAQSMDRANAQQPDKAKERDKSRKRNLLRLKKFVAHYCVHFNGAAAIRFAGYDTAWPSAYATELLTKPEVQDEIKKVRDDLGELHFDLANRATAQLTAMMQADRAGIFTPEGVVKDFDEWPEDCKLLLAGVEVEELWEGTGKDRRPIGTLRKIKLEAPKGILDSILKVTGKFIERTQMLDRHGNPVDPGTVAPIIEVTVGLDPAKKGGRK